MSYFPDTTVTIDTLAKVARNAAEVAVRDNGCVHPEDIVANIVPALDAAAMTLMHLHESGRLDNPSSD